MQDFLLCFIFCTDKEMSHSLLLSTFTAICVTVTNFKSVSIKMASANSELAHKWIYKFIAIFKVAIFWWLQSKLEICFEIWMVLVISDQFLEIIPRPCKMWKEGTVVFLIWSWEIFIFVIWPCIIFLIFFFRQEWSQQKKTSVPGVPRRPRPNQRCYLHLWCRFL